MQTPTMRMGYVDIPSNYVPLVSICANRVEPHVAVILYIRFAPDPENFT